MSENNRCFLNIYIGTPNEEDWQDFLYLDLVVPGKEVNLYTSPEPLNTDSGQDLLDNLEAAFNMARLFTKSLGLRVRVEMEEILAMAEEVDESSTKNIKSLLTEMEV